MVCFIIYFLTIFYCSVISYGITAQQEHISLNEIGAEWSSWGDFGECSRPCGGGLSNRTRSCMGASHTCKGSGIRYKICNQQGCPPKDESLRDRQCASYNDVSIKDNYYHWIPHFSASDPCVLFCKAVESGAILKMHTIVWNGTVCGTNGRDVCIKGICKKVGCDDLIGSNKVMDMCGTCGGDGRSCDMLRGSLPTPGDDSMKRLYEWDTRWNACSKSCGKGTQSSFVSCILSDTGQEVDESYCEPISRPDPSPNRQCQNDVSCNFRWHVFKWGACSRSCGNGFKYRRIVCVKEYGTGPRQRVHDRKCSEVKPAIKDPCYLGDCPEWLTGPWSMCSASCGIGEQKRKVVCRPAATETCNSLSKPSEMQECFSGKPCPVKGEIILQKDESLLYPYDSFDDAMLQDLLNQPRFNVSSWGPCTASCGIGYQLRDISCKIGDKVEPLSRCPGDKPHGKRECNLPKCPVDSMTANSYFIWQHRQFDTCSQTCGRGIQRSRLFCVDIRNNRTVLDSQCNGLVQPDLITRHCNSVNCPPRWRAGEYAECSLPCGGGKQSRSVDCVMTTSYGGLQKMVTLLCPDPIPFSERRCNTHFCQAEWNTGSWGECSVTCGQGTESRSVYCVKQMSFGLQVNVSNTECLGLRPSAIRECDFGDCYKLQHLPEIKEKIGTFIQIKRTKRVALYVGEIATILPNQQVKLKCPVKNFQRKLIFWTKDRRLIPQVGRVRVSSKGALRIARANPKTDNGVYTCIVGMLKANVQIKFHNKRQAKEKAVHILESILKESLLSEHFNKNMPQADEQQNSISVEKQMKQLTSNLDASQTNSIVHYSSFSTSYWTTCSVTCGYGTQSRVVTCNHVTENYIRLLPEKECLKKGLRKPTSVKKCMLQEECPNWSVEEWSKCSSNTCVEDGYALEERPLHCKYRNGTGTMVTDCDISVQPEHKRKCEQSDCQSVWKSSSWSECYPKCGKKGFKSRFLSCIWVTNKQSAFDKCDYKPRPSVSKSCKPKSCRSVRCQDKSEFCSLARYLKMCRYLKFRRRCCATCKQVNTF